MKRKISLYINDHLVDLDEQTFILFNYTYEELDNPTIVKNSFSQQITLKGTPNNNAIFGDAFRLDRVVGDSSSNYGVGFNPSRKTPFTIYNDMAEILETGYVKLDSITGNGNNVEYKVTLYGGLGSLLYQLSYTEDGDKMTLADLDFLGTSNPETELNYNIGRTLVKQAWERLGGQSPITLFDTINFIPCYEGIPDNFDADKAYVNSEVVGIENNTRIKCNLAKSYTYMETHDMRSQLLRPVIRFKAILTAIQRFATAKGYNLTIDQGVTDTPYYDDLWLTLPILNKKSGELFTKDDILGGSKTPCDYLLSYCKMFGLKLLVDLKDITIMSRDDYFINKVVDLSEMIDSSNVEITPINFDAKWFEMSNGNSGEFAKYYEETYGRTYGSQRINTGNEFNSDVSSITDSLVFKGAVQSKEMSAYMMGATKNTMSQTYGVVDFPPVFFDGGTWTRTLSDGTKEENALNTGRLYYQWWNTESNGLDINDFLQLHEAENKKIDGGDILVLFTGMVQCSNLQLSDDLAEMTENPCWNLTTTNVDTLTTIPHFSRFKVSSGQITRTLDFGQAKELNVPGLAYGSDDVSVYAERWRSYLRDRYDVNTKKVGLKVHFQENVTGTMLRYFYWFKNSLWVLNAIKNHSLTTFDPVECEFIQVQDKNNYLSGQIL